MKKGIASFVAGLLFFAGLSGMAHAAGSGAGTGSVNGSVTGVIELTQKEADELKKLKKNWEKQEKKQGFKFEVQTNRKGERAKQNGGLEVYRGLPNVVVQVGEYETKTNEDGLFTIGEIPTGKYEYKIVNNGSVLRAGTITIKDGETVTIDVEAKRNLQQVAKNMGMGSGENGVKPLTHTHRGAPHCNKAGSPGRWAFPANGSDCSWALFVRWFSYCWNEAMNNDAPATSYSRYCNGKGKVYKYYAPCRYTGWHGISCSYIRGHSEFYHYN